MSTDVNPKPEVLRRVYAAQMSDYAVVHTGAVRRLLTAKAALQDATAEHNEALAAEARVLGSMDALRLQAARDGIDLD